MRFIPSEKEIQFRILKKEGMNLQLLISYGKELYKMCHSAVMWPKLQLQQEKPHWLRLDFDHMGESSDEAEDEDVNVDKEVSQVKIVDGN